MSVDVFCYAKSVLQIPSSFFKWALSPAYSTHHINNSKWSLVEEFAKHPCQYLRRSRNKLKWNWVGGIEAKEVYWHKESDFHSSFDIIKEFISSQPNWLLWFWTLMGLLAPVYSALSIPIGGSVFLESIRKISGVYNKIWFCQPWSWNYERKKMSPKNNCFDFAS